MGWELKGCYAVRSGSDERSEGDTVMFAAHQQCNNGGTAGRTLSGNGERRWEAAVVGQAAENGRHET